MDTPTPSQPTQPLPAELAAWAGYTADDGYALDPELGSAGGRVVHYDGGDWVEGVPTRDDLVAASEGGAEAAARVRADSLAGRPVCFMPVDVEDSTEYLRGRAVYALRVYGHTEDGTAAEAVLTGIEPFFDVELAPGRGLEALRPVVDGVLTAEASASGARYEVVRAYPLRGYREAPVAWARVFLATLPVRKKAIAAVREAGFATASDDLSNYYRKAARELGLVLSDWAVLTAYEYTRGPTERAPRSRHSYRVPAAEFRPLIDDGAPPAERAAAVARKAAAPLLARSRTLVVAWDLETVPHEGSTALPLGSVAGDEAFMCCLTAHWIDDAAPIARICLVAAETAPDPRWVTVVCRTPAALLRALALSLQALRPDVLAGFNDGGYDWPFVVDKAKLLGGEFLAWFWNAVSAAPRRNQTDEGVLKWNYRERQRIKLSAEATMDVSYLRWPGCVPVDVRVSFKRLYTKSDNPMAGSLRFYLELCELPAKIDLPHSRLWWAYRRAVAAAAAGDAAGAAAAAECLRQAAHYCVTDSHSCQRLLVARTVLADYRAVSGIARLSTADSHYYATGLKVGNLLAGTAFRRGILVSMQTREGGDTKYAGAYVFPPEKGLVPDPGRLAAVEAAAAELRAALAAVAVEGETLRETLARVEGAGAEPWGPFGAPVSGKALLPQPADVRAARAAVEKAIAGFAGSRPVTGLDFTSLYPSLIMAYNLSPEKVVFDPAEAAALRARGFSLHEVVGEFQGRTVRAWFVRHGEVPEQIGLYPTVLIDLFARRAAEKRVLGPLTEAKELIDLVDERAKTESVPVAEALRRQLADAEATIATTSEALAPGAPPPRVSPGSTPAEELADLARRRGNAVKQAELLRRYLAAGVTDAEIGAALAAEYVRVCFDWVRSNSRQNALKVYMNSFYGETGNSLSPFYLLELALGVTLAGQYNIKMVSKVVQGLGFLVKYGDSVTGDTALVVRAGGVIRTSRIDELAADGAWTPYGDKEAAIVPGLEVWQDGGFTPVGRVIRHVLTKPIRRVLTETGVVDCTTDHSLLRPDGARVSPEDVAVGDELLHASSADLVGELGRNVDGAVSAAEAYIMGRFVAEGGVRGLATQHYGALFANGHGERRLPPCILSAELGATRAFWRGFLRSRWAGPPPLGQDWHVDVRGKEMATGLALLGRRLGWAVFLDDCAAPDAFRLTFSTAHPRRRPVVVVKGVEPSYLCGAAGHVYDLETESHHFHVGPGDLVVHNTDSLYLVPPNHFFAECDEGFVLGELDREGWWAASVRITMRALNGARDRVNAALHADNGTRRLMMAYEEVIYPAAFIGKKKYYGVPHLNEVNFRPKKLFIRGVDVIKVGQAGLTKTVGFRVMWASMALDNTRPLRQIVDDVLRDAVTNPGQWQFKDFVKTDAWRPDKNNVAVHRFVERMTAQEKAELARRAAGDAAARPELYAIPAPGDRFSYVIVRPRDLFTLRGCRAALGKGDRMEFVRVAQARALEVDVTYYLIKNVAGLCARFINSDSEFQPPPPLPRQRGADGAPLPEWIKAADKAAQEAAKKWVEDRIKALGGHDPAQLRRQGIAYRRAYSGAAAAASQALVERLGPGAEMLQGPWTDYEAVLASTESAGSSAAQTAAVVEALWKAAGQLAGALAEEGASAWCEKLALAAGIDADGSDVEPETASPETVERAELESASPAAPPEAASPAAAGQEETSQGPDRGEQGAPPDEPPRGEKGERPGRRGSTSVNLYSAPEGRAGRRPATGAETAWLAALSRSEDRIREELAGQAPLLASVAARFEADLLSLVQARRWAEHASNPAELGRPETAAEAPPQTVTEADRVVLESIRARWYEAAGFQLVEQLSRRYAAHLRQLKDRRVRAVTPPPRAKTRKAIADAAASLQPSGLAEAIM